MDDVNMMKPQNCPHCGMIHETTCPRISAIEYHPNGSVKRVEFGAPQRLDWGTDTRVKMDGPAPYTAGGLPAA